MACFPCPYPPFHPGSFLLCIALSWDAICGATSSCKCPDSTLAHSFRHHAGYPGKLHITGDGLKDGMDMLHVALLLKAPDTLANNSLDHFTGRKYCI